MNGTSGNDVLRGTSYIDVIYGYGGNDTIYGYGSGDTINAGSGNDRVYGGEGDDILGGVDGNDTIYGENGRDALFGGNGKDTLFGGEKDDWLFGGADNDRLFGGSGNDYLQGDEGDDVLRGASSRASVEIDELLGGDGRDTFVVGTYSGNFYANAGERDYALIRDFSAGDRIVLDNGSYSIGASPIAGIDGTAIYQNTAEGSDLIAIVEGIHRIGQLDFQETELVTNVTLSDRYSFGPGTIFDDQNLRNAPFNRATSTL